MRRVLLVGHGQIGREVFAEYRELDGMELMVTDLDLSRIPAGFEWDGRWVDAAVVMVDTPLADSHLSRLDYRPLAAAVSTYLAWADFVVIRSTVAPDFLQLTVYRDNTDCVGFVPEFYGTTRHSRRGELELDFLIVSDSVPQWFVDLTADGRKPLRAPAGEVVISKLTENAYLAMKVTFFHELSITCERLGLSFDLVREMVTSDPRITPAHSYRDAGLGWSSHCFNKDVPTFAGLGGGSRLLSAVIDVNEDLLACREAI